MTTKKNGKGRTKKAIGADGFVNVRITKAAWEKANALAEKMAGDILAHSGMRVKIQPGAAIEKLLAD